MRRAPRPAVIRAFVLIASVVLVVSVHGLLGSRDGSAPFFSDLPLGSEALMPVPHGNPLSASKVELGRLLFFDPRLSRDGAVSCASCHRPELAFTDGRPRAVGIDRRKGRRNTPSLLDSAYRASLFWDGRAATLEAQALSPIENPDEMGHSVAAVLADLRRDEGYVRAFDAAFGTPDIAPSRLAAALASYQRTLVAGGAPYDRAIAGEPGALGVAARRGLVLFEGRARCRFCHQGPRLTDEAFHNTGVGWGREPRDLGRFEVTRAEADRGRFRTASLRELVWSAPYMHDGSFETLRQVVDFYAGGAGGNPDLDPLIRPIALSDDERDDLVAFLQSLSSGDHDPR